MSAPVELPLLPPPYRLVKHIGAGAAGDVYLVENGQRLEAMKVLKPVGTKDAIEIAQRRFEREIRIAQSLSHPSIVATYNTGMLADGRRYLTMEYVVGRSIHDLLQWQGALSVTLALGILAEAADALHHAHASGVVHRDIKPHNLVLSEHPAGHLLRVLDFGMAKMIGAVETGPVLTDVGAVFGTPAYMSPEQVRGAPADPRIDIYALGCLGFELLVGETPFRGSVSQLLVAHITQKPRTPSVVWPDAGIAPELDQVVLRCLAKRPEDRFQSGADLCAAIQSIDAYRPLRVFR